MFKQAFKRYKRKEPPPDVQDVIDLNLYEANDTSTSWYNLVQPVNISERSVQQNLLPVGLQPQKNWRCYTLKNRPGLWIIRNPFTWSGQRYWMARCLRDYPRGQNVVNLDANQFSPAAISDWWQELHQCSDKKLAQRLKVGMRWTTLGYHHDWDTKVYNEEMHTEFPSDLSSLCQYFALVLGYKNYLSQAAIVNYYPIGTTLSGHTDHSELNLAAPLFSFSFGQSAIFLIGGKTIEEEPSAIFLHSGDVLVMSEESRLCYHAVPRVMKTHKEPWNEIDNVTKGNDEETIVTDFNSMDMKLFTNVSDKLFWLPFDNYLADSRININVRQVLPANITRIEF